jgi:tRNA wybutosine-synthesizing protein 3
MSQKASARFEMTKKHHAKILQGAITEKKIDPLMIPISTFLNKLPKYFTTSTCSGRITLMDLEANEHKRKGAFFRKWHRMVKLEEVWKGMMDNSNTGNVWFKQDAFVYVIGTDSRENAQKVFDACQKTGIKRFGVHHFGEGKIILEVFGTQSMSVPVKTRAKILVDKKYVKELVIIANRKWKENEKKRKEFEKNLRAMVT